MHSGKNALLYVPGQIVICRDNIENQIASVDAIQENDSVLVDVPFIPATIAEMPKGNGFNFTNCSITINYHAK